jgi:hypothetical protein
MSQPFCTTVPATSYFLGHWRSALNIADFNILSPNKTIPFRTKWSGKDKLYKRRNGKICTMSGFLGAAIQRIWLKNIYLTWSGIACLQHIGSVTNLGGDREMWHQKPLSLGLKGSCSPEWFDRLDLDCFGVELPPVNPWTDEESPRAFGRPIASASREYPLSTVSVSSGISSKVWEKYV